jgi:hypothetical protein
VDDHCAECGYDGRDFTVRQVAAALAALPADIETLVRSAADAALRTRPAPTTWCALEYLGHLRDLMAFHRYVIERAIAEDAPTLELVDPDEFVTDAGYRDADVDALLAQFARRVARLVTFVEGMDQGALIRTVRFGDDSLDVRLVMLSALHEGVHHQGDIEAVLADTTSLQERNETRVNQRCVEPASTGNDTDVT